MKKAIIVGATSGVGRSLALSLAAEGYKVGITGRRQHLLQEISGMVPGAFVPVAFDISETEKLPFYLDDLTSQLGGLDLLIISSGVVNFNLDLDIAIEQETIATNVAGFTAVAIWGFNYFKGKKKGHLVGITSIGGLRGGRYTPAYNASKAFQINYLEGLRHKSASLNLPIVVTDIRPGFIDTQMAKGEGKFWMATLEKATSQILHAIKKQKEVAYITRRWALMGLLFKLLPRTIYQNLVLRMKR